MLGVIGLFAESVSLRRWMARLMLGAHVYYGFLDFRASDSPLGNGLYQSQGPASLGPAILCVVMVVLFAHLSFCPTAIGSPREGPDDPRA